MQTKKILVVGSLNMDLVVKVPRMPKVGETLLGYSFVTTPGGKGANQAFAASRFGGDVTMIGKVGTDEYGQILLNNLKASGVNVDGISTEQGINTGLAFIYVNDEGDNSIVVVPGANMKFDIDDIENYKAIIKDCDILIAQLEIKADFVFRLLEIAKKMGKTVILNPAPAPLSIPDEVLRNVDILTPNESELQRLTGKETNTIEEIKDAAEFLLRKGVGRVIVTWGEKGAVLIDSSGCRQFPARNVRVVDTTAAGDSFTAAVAVAISEGRSLPEAITFANMAASIVVTREGAQASIPSRDEIG